MSRRSLVARIGAQTTVLAHDRPLFVVANSSTIGSSKSSRALIVGQHCRLALLAFGRCAPGRPHPQRSTGHTLIMRAARRAGALVLLAVVALFAAPTAAMAHAVLLTTDPARGAVLARAPAYVSLRFDEAVYVQLGSIDVFGPKGQRVDTGHATHGPGGGAAVRVRLRRGLGRGTYVVAWRVISDDSHPVSGAFAFSVGARSGGQASAAADAALTRGSPAVGAVFAVARWAGFAAFALLVGGAFFVAVCWPVGAAVPRARRVIYAGWAALVAATVAALLLQGPYGGGLGLGAALSPRVVGDTLLTRFGQEAMGRLVVLGLIQIYLGWLFARGWSARGREGAALCGLGAALAVALAATWPLAGHSSVGIQVPLAVAADAAHLLAMAIWVGGLALLTGVVLRGARVPGRRVRDGAAADRAAGDGVAAAAAVARFSPIALGCVAALGATGIYQAWRQVGTWQALATTDYGRLILLKTAGLCALVGLGAYSRRALSGRVMPRALTRRGVALAHQPADLCWPRGGMAPSGGHPRTPDGPGSPRLVAAVAPASVGASHTAGRVGGDQSGAGAASLGGTPPPATGRQGKPPAVGDLRRSVMFETLVAAGVLAATAILVNAAPARTAAGAPQAAVSSTTARPQRVHARLAMRTYAAEFSAGGPGGSGTLRAITARSGSGARALYLSVRDRRGRLLPVPGVTATFAQPATGFGPIRCALVRAGPGNFIAPLMLPAGETWRLSVTITTAAKHTVTVTMITAIP
jgi:copper transport protein